MLSPARIRARRWCDPPTGFSSRDRRPDPQGYRCATRPQPRSSGPDQVSYWRPRQDSNLRSRLRRAVLYPLSYGGPASGPRRTVSVVGGPPRTLDVAQRHPDTARESRPAAGWAGPCPDVARESHTVSWPGPLPGPGAGLVRPGVARSERVWR